MLNVALVLGGGGSPRAQLSWQFLDDSLGVPASRIWCKRGGRCCLLALLCCSAIASFDTQVQPRQDRHQGRLTHFFPTRWTVQMRVREINFFFLRVGVSFEGVFPVLVWVWRSPGLSGRSHASLRGGGRPSPARASPFVPEEEMWPAEWMRNDGPAAGKRRTSRVNKRSYLKFGVWHLWSIVTMMLAGFGGVAVEFRRRAFGYEDAELVRL